MSPVLLGTMYVWVGPELDNKILDTWTIELNCQIFRVVENHTLDHPTTTEASQYRVTLSMSQPWPGLMI
jgi:hypothetical protein